MKPKNASARPKPYYERKVRLNMDAEECRQERAKRRTTQQKVGRIPKVLVLTGKNESFDSLPHDTKAKFMRILEEDPSMKLRWLGDKACTRYIEEHYDQELLRFFNNETHGSRRGDVCRTAVLLREGGFYLDLDITLKTPLLHMVDGTTSFMSVFEEPLRINGGLLNAVIAAEPGSTFLNRTLLEIRKWYRGVVAKVEPYGGYHWMGPATLMRGFLSTMDTDCPCEDLDRRRRLLHSKNADKQWVCGSHVVRLYSQLRLRCKHHRDPEECSEKRAKTRYDGSQFGLFEPGIRRKLIGWCRPESCDHEGCGLGGWDEISLLAQNASSKVHKPLVRVES